MTRLKAVLLILLVINVQFTQGYLTSDAYLYTPEAQEIQEFLFPMSKGVDMTQELKSASEIAKITREAKQTIDNISQVTQIAADFADNTSKVLKAAEVAIKVTKFLDAIAKIGSFIPGLSAISGVLSLVDIFDPKKSDTTVILEAIEKVSQKIDKLEITVKEQADRIIKKLKVFGCKIYLEPHIKLIQSLQRLEQQIMQSRDKKITEGQQKLLVTLCGGDSDLKCYNAGQAILEQFKQGSACSIMKQIYNGAPESGQWQGDVQQMVQTSTYFLNLALDGLKFAEAKQTLSGGQSINYLYREDLKEATDTIKRFITTARTSDFANAKFNANIVFNNKAKQYAVNSASSQVIANSMLEMFQSGFPQYQSIVIVYNGNQNYKSSDYAYAFFGNGILGNYDNKFSFAVHLIPTDKAQLYQNYSWQTQKMNRYWDIGWQCGNAKYALKSARGCANNHQKICLTGVMTIWNKNGAGAIGHAISPFIRPFVEVCGGFPPQNYMWIMDWNIGSTQCIWI